ncbi:hypothetical protein CQ12_40350 [Bradyrhizobium jicamae]|uniref:Uncharacterized protein n=1 Tax=Bradyrhizobium jicamae TaxID=280332 RepID=A0A0R3M4Q9_9BRAD|nr:hypothetical protein [Bradyrhizobium jicamae]KRR15033.1 hypothetical protein CQ12_40350 [Bradyrhizobium jicamae]
MSGTGMKWQRLDKRKPTQFANTRFPRDDLGKAAKAAWIAWKASLTPKQKRQLFRGGHPSAPQH